MSVNWRFSNEIARHSRINAPPQTSKRPPDVALTIADRVAILTVLDDPPDGLAELRGALLSEHEWRRREGLA